MQAHEVDAQKCCLDSQLTRVQKLHSLSRFMTVFVGILDSLLAKGM